MEPRCASRCSRARAIGLRVADLASPVAAYLAERGHTRAALVLSESDNHPTPLHHRIIADALYEQQLRELLEARVADSAAESERRAAEMSLRIVFTARLRVAAYP